MPGTDRLRRGQCTWLLGFQVIAVLNFMYIDVHKPMFPQAMKISTTFYAFVRLCISVAPLAATC